MNYTRYYLLATTLMEKIDFYSELYGIYAVWYRELKVFLREKARVISTVASPLLWFFLFGGGLASRVQIENIDYQKFIFPGILMMSVVFSSLFFGVYIIWDRKIDALKEILSAPVSRVSIFFGKLLGGATDIMTQTLILLTIGVFLVGYGPVELLITWGLMFIISLSMLSVGLTIGSLLESLEGFQLISTFIAFPMVFLSGAFYPVSDNLPFYLLILTKLNPLTYGVDAIRAIMLNYFVLSPLLNVAIMLLFCLATMIVGAVTFSRIK